jgi:TfoX/Sxy family transcriptional regulator of competence genes
MTAKPKPELPVAEIALYDKLVALFPTVERKGATLPYTSHNGNMFSFMSADGTLAIRLGEDERNAFIKKHKSKLMEAHGTIMKEYVAVPGKLLKDTKELKKWFALSVEYAGTLKPKATKRKK